MCRVFLCLFHQPAQLRLGFFMDRHRMSEKVKALAEGMERSGAGAAVASWLGSMILHLDKHSQAWLAICGIVGALVGVVGLLLKWCHMRYERQLLNAEHAARMRLLQQGKIPQ